MENSCLWLGTIRQGQIPSRVPKRVYWWMLRRVAGQEKPSVFSDKRWLPRTAEAVEQSQLWAYLMHSVCCGKPFWAQKIPRLNSESQYHQTSEMIPYLSSVVSWLSFLFLIHPLHLVCVIGVGGNGFGLLQRPEVNIRYLPSSLTILFLEIKSLTELEDCWFRETGWPSPASVPPVLRLQTHHTCLLYTASWISLRCLCL